MLLPIFIRLVLERDEVSVTRYVVLRPVMNALGGALAGAGTLLLGTATYNGSFGGGGDLNSAVKAPSPAPSPTTEGKSDSCSP